MAYSTSNPPALISQRVGANGGAVFVLKTTDDIGDVLADDYISNGYDLGIKAGDVVIVIDSTNVNLSITKVASVTTDGAATLEVSSLQELTASGAVTPGVRILELNHATVAIAATVADAAAHAGLFIIKDTSASGTAAHTVTLTSGTFDGTNNVATLNAPAEQLIVYFDDTGTGVIVQNTGAVALS
jgi:hypothetical protein